MKGLAFEYNKLKTNKLLYGLCLLIVVFIVYCQYDAMRSGIDAPGYIISTGLASLNITGTFFCIFTGAFVFYSDWNWNTYQYLFIHATNRRKVCYAKFLIILLSTLFVLVLVIVFTCGVYIISTGTLAGMFPNKLVLQILYTLISMFFWSGLSFTLTALTRNVIIGVLVPFALSNFEVLLYQYIGLDIARFLPSFNIKSLLSFAFDNLKPGSMIIFPNFGYDIGAFNHFYIFVFLLVYFIVNLRIFQKMEVPS